MGRDSDEKVDFSLVFSPQEASTNRKNEQLLFNLFADLIRDEKKIELLHENFQDDYFYLACIKADITLDS